MASLCTNNTLAPSEMFCRRKRTLDVFNILLVDDTWSNLMSIKNCLKKMKIKDVIIKVYTCIDGEIAV